MTGVVAGVTEGWEETTRETPESNGWAEEGTEAQDERMEDMGLQDSIEVVPQSPTVSALFSDVTNPPSSTEIEITNVDDPMAGGGDVTRLAALIVARVNQSRGFAKQPKKRGQGSDDESSHQEEGGEMVKGRAGQSQPRPDGTGRVSETTLITLPSPQEGERVGQ